MGNKAYSLICPSMLETMEKLASSVPPGAFVEVGVYTGGSASVLYDIAMAQGRELHLYDTFEGMPISQPELGDRHVVGDFDDCSEAQVRDSLPKASIHKGLFPDTFSPVGPIAFVHADADQYFSTLAVCMELAPHMVSGGMILFDDYTALEGCRRAVDKIFGDKMELLPDGRALVRF